MTEQTCPQCGTEMYSHDVARVFWCDTCELEYRRDGTRWFRTDVEGNTRLVRTETLQSTYTDGDA